MRYVISKKVDPFFTSVYDSFLFIIRFFRELFRPPYEFQELVRQCYEVGVRSFPLITVTGLITGLVFTKQSRPSLAEFGAESWLPSLVGIAVIKSLAPLVTALICAGKVGSSMGAELGSMRVTEQVDAMDVSGVNAFKYLVVSRVLATSLMLPMLMMYAAFVGLMGSYIDIAANDQTSITAFFQRAFEKITFIDFGSTVFRSMVFGFTIGIIGCFKGYHTTGGTQGVGKSANLAVVISMFLIFIEEMVIIQIVGWFR